jgi:hypothetical protein
MQGEASHFRDLGGAIIEERHTEVLADGKYKLVSRFESRSTVLQNVKDKLKGENSTRENW